MATQQQDNKQATDLIIEQPLRFAVRVRKAEHVTKYGDQFTMRAGTLTGAHASEIEKVLSGWGDYMCYGFGNAETGQLVRYYILNLAVLRTAITNNPELLGKRYLQRNPGGNWFYAWPLSAFPGELVYATNRYTQ